MVCYNFSLVRGGRRHASRDRYREEGARSEQERERTGTQSIASFAGLQLVYSRLVGRTVGQLAAGAQFSGGKVSDGCGQVNAFQESKYLLNGRMRGVTWRHRPTLATSTKTTPDRENFMGNLSRRFYSSLEAVRTSKGERQIEKMLPTAFHKWSWYGGGGGKSRASS